MKSVLKMVGIVFGILIGLIVLANLILYTLGGSRLNHVYTIQIEPISIPNNDESLAEGKRIFQYRGCEACHGEELQGLVYLDNPAIGQVITPNLTTGEGGIGSQRTDEELLRSIRHGVRPDGTPLLFMPSTEFYFLSDEDSGRVIAYIRSVPPINNEMPASKLSITGRIVMNVAKEITFLPAEMIPHNAPRPIPPEPGITPEYGEYLTYSCKVCHGPTLSGGEIPGFPPEWPSAPNLTSGKGSRLPTWGEKGFLEILRTGKKHGRTINSDYMPWKSYRHMTDDELRAVYLYLQSLQPKDFGNR
jgi:mono/diheme cytochrome c family protein